MAHTLHEPLTAPSSPSPDETVLDTNGLTHFPSLRSHHRRPLLARLSALRRRLGTAGERLLFHASTAADDRDAYSYDRASEAEEDAAEAEAELETELEAEDAPAATSGSARTLRERRQTQLQQRRLLPSHHADGTRRMMDRAASHHQSRGKMRIRRVNVSRRLLGSDWFHGVVQVATWKLFVAYALLYLLLFVLFALVYLAESDTCALETETFLKAFYFSIITMSTIG